MTADHQKIPSWSAFNTMVSCGAPSTTEVRYFPMINGTSTDYNTVYTFMKQVQQMMSSLGQKYSVVTLDLAIYMKTKEIQWRHPEEFDDTVIRMGGFHIALHYLAAIGDSGLLDLIIVSDIYGCSTASCNFVSSNLEWLCQRCTSVVILKTSNSSVSQFFSHPTQGRGVPCLQKMSFWGLG